LLIQPKMSYYSRIINSLLAFAAVGTTPTKPHGGRGLRCPDYPGVFTLHGRTYHVWVPPSEEGPARGHTLPLPDSLLLDRIDSIANKRKALELLDRWRRYLRTHNPLSNTLAHAFDRRHRGEEALSVSIAPSTEISNEMEVALVYPDSPSGPPERYAVSFPLRPNRRDKHKNRMVPESSALYDIMHYPLLHPRGQGGFNMPATASRLSRNSSIAASSASRVVRAKPHAGKRHQFTLQQWAKANVYQNERLHHLGRLMQEWCLDQFSRIQRDNLAYLQNRAQSVFVVPMRAIRAGAKAIAAARRRVYLSRKVVGSRRYLDGKVADGMAIVQAMDKPTYFITFTANSKWPEIAALLAHRGQSGIDRPDATMRVFKLKLQEFLEDLRKGRIFGRKAVYIFYVIEFQKRGLPHAHSE
jgi:hypothetical protein